jgi:hypothetical protein
VKPLDRLGDREREVVVDRTRSGYGNGPLHELAEHEPVLRMLLDDLLPGVPLAIDLGAFVDANTGRPLGRGDRPVGTPAEPELFRVGLAALSAAGFDAMDGAGRRNLVARMRHAEADEELGIPAKLFIDRLLDKALIGYLAHPDTWERIGFQGPAYPDGYAWIGPDEIVARRERKPGWKAL